MSNEIVSALDGSETRSAETSKDANGMRCRPHGFSLRKGIGARVNIDLIGDNHTMSQFLTSDQRLKHVSHLNPTLASVEPLLEKMKEPSVLLLRGCDLLLQACFPFEKFKTLTSLEISGISYLTTVPDAISEMTQLQALNLSHLPIKRFPSDELLSNLRHLRSLFLRGCYNLHSLPPLPYLPALQCLDLSDLPIETFPSNERLFRNIIELRCLILRGCSRLCSVPRLSFFKKLELLDLSHCTALQEINLLVQYQQSNLQMLDLSYTALPKFTLLNCAHLTHLFLREIKEIEFEYMNPIPGLTMVDLSGVQVLKGVDKLKGSRDLVAVDLSRTGIQSVDFLSDLIHLRHLVLRECTELVNLPEMKRLTNLEVLDISGCEILADLPEDLNNLRSIKELNLSGCTSLTELREGLFDDMPCLEKLDLSKTNANHLPSFSSLTNLRTLNLSHTPVEKLPDLSNLGNLKELLLENCQRLEDVPDIQRLSNVDKTDLGLPRNDGIDLIGVQLSGIERISNPDEFHLVSTFIGESGFDRFKYEFTKLQVLISNIEKKIKSTSPDKIILSTTTNKMSQSFIQKFGSIHGDLSYILQNIDLLESSSNCKSSEELLHELMNATTTGLSDDDFSLDSIDLSELIRVVAKLKLLVPPRQVGGEEGDVKKKKTTKKILLSSNKDEKEAIDPNALQLQNLLSSYDSLTDIQRNCLLYFAAFSGGLRIKERTLIWLWYGEAQAKGSLFFDFDDKNEKLTSRFTGSQRACLLKSQAHCLSSCPLWLSYANSSKKQESFKNIRTLLHVSESIIDLNVEWFSKMRNLIVLHLGSLNCEDDEHVDVVDLKFLEELENMKQLRLLSLESLLAIVKLPDSACNLTNLRMLSLKYCCNLEELPAGIGSLKNLIHLDLTHCHLLSKLPKGLALLSQLEVLKGFVITYEDGGQQHAKACTLRELLKLKNLRKLNLVVNRDKFPYSNDLHVFKEMKSLCNLKITWEKNCHKGQEPEDAIGHEALRYSRWKQLKCWEQQTCQTDNEEPLSSNRLHDLKKLVMCCFPLETAPNWLHPSELQKLEKLYIVGGNLKTFPGLADPNTWSVKTLHLKYLSKLDVNWRDVRNHFPVMTAVQQRQCPHIRNFGLVERIIWSRK